MTDIFSPPPVSKSKTAPPAPPAEVAATALDPNATPDLVACAELFYFAYREFTRDPDIMLEQYGFGRAHHRVLHFVRRHPGLIVADLLDILNITKQSLARVLKQLIDEGFIIQRAGDEDRRERRLYVSAKGTRLTDKLTDLQTRRLGAAFAALGLQSEDLARQFLTAMIAQEDRAKVEMLLRTAAPITLQAPSQTGHKGGR
jgi:DNA-binding MarR family transcriptional regulator